MRILDYNIEQEIGRGGMGVVYQAYSPALDRKVALKVLLEGSFLSEGARERFHIEAQATVGISTA